LLRLAVAVSSRINRNDSGDITCTIYFEGVSSPSAGGSISTLSTGSDLKNGQHKHRINGDSLTQNPYPLSSHFQRIT
jgi:hypothetical protein